MNGGLGFVNHWLSSTGPLGERSLPGKDQNRKYLCAMGSTDMGSQRSSRPSAVTV